MSAYGSIALRRPFSTRGACSAPLHHVVMVVVQPVSECQCHKSCASLKTHAEDVKFLARREVMMRTEGT